MRLVKKSLLLAVGCALSIFTSANSLALQFPVSADTSNVTGSGGPRGSVAVMAVGANQKTYLQFDLASLPPGTTGQDVANATMRFFLRKVTSTGAVSVLQVAAPWEEKTLNGKNAPALGPVQDTINIAPGMMKTFASANVTALVQSWVDAPQNNFGVAITSSGPNAFSISIDSKESPVSHYAVLDIDLVTGGLQGPVGAVGPAGPAGEAGPAGPVGPAGATGPAGPQGNPGNIGPMGIPGIQGPIGPIGLTGANGADGAAGPAGPAGPAGAPGSGAIIPYSSGLPITMTTVLGGLNGTSSIIGFGNSATGITQVGGVIDLTGGPGVNMNYAFSVPRDGTITSLTGFFSSTQAVALVGTTVTVTAQLYRSTTPDNTFVPIPGALVTLAPSLTGILAIGTIENGLTTGLAIPVSAQDRLLLVFTSTVTAGIDQAVTISGYASGGMVVQ